MNTLTFLGRGSGYHITENNTSAYYIKNGTMLLIDCGETVFKTLLNNRLLDEIEELYIIITHMHSDHVGSLAGLIGYYYWKYHKLAKLFYPEKEKMKQYLALLGMIEDEAYTFVSGGGFSIDHLEMTVTPVKTLHNPIIDAYSYHLNFIHGNDIFYSGDSKILLEDAVNFLNAGNLIYQDICISENDQGPHMTLNKMVQLIPLELRSQVYCIHVDGEDYDAKTSAYGFSKVKENEMINRN